MMMQKNISGSFQSEVWKLCAFDETHFEVLMPSALSYCFSLSVSLSVSCREKGKKKNVEEGQEESEICWILL